MSVYASETETHMRARQRKNDDMNNDAVGRKDIRYRALYVER